jgi:hypothetical protein
LRYEKRSVKTTDGANFDGVFITFFLFLSPYFLLHLPSPYLKLAFDSRIYVLSMIRSGECMEGPIRKVCQNIKIGKICLDREEEGRRVFFVIL